MAEQDKKKEPYSWCVSLSTPPPTPPPPNILTLFVWCRYWVSSEKSGLRSRRMAASVCWAGIGMLYGTNASGLAWTSWQYNFTLFFFSPSPSLYVSLSLSLNKLLALHLHHNHPGVEEEVWIRPKHTIMSAKPWLPADHYGSTMEIKSVKRRKREREKKKQQQQEGNPVHFIRLSLPFSLCV